MWYLEFRCLKECTPAGVTTNTFRMLISLFCNPFEYHSFLPETIFSMSWATKGPYHSFSTPSNPLLIFLFLYISISFAFPFFFIDTLWRLRNSSSEPSYLAISFLIVILLIASQVFLLPFCFFLAISFFLHNHLSRIQLLERSAPSASDA